MAATYTWPGVYVVEVPSAIQPIAGAGTSTAAFIGVSADIAAAAMPVNAAGTAYTQAAALTAVPVNSWSEFTQNFGAIQTANQYLAQAVFGFFNNGGTRCWVTRLTEATIADFTTALTQLESIDEIAVVAALLPPSAPPPPVAPAAPTDTSPTPAAPADSTATAPDTPAPAEAPAAPSENEPAPPEAPAAPDADADWQSLLNQVQTAVVGHCEAMQNRFAILDSACDIKGDNLVITSNADGIWRPADSQYGYGAFYFPWILVADPLGTMGASVAVPPSGHLAGVFARNDAERGVFKAPANENIRGALDLRYPVSKILQGTLNLDGVNCIRSFQGTIKVYGARTLASHKGTVSEWQYVSVRRLISYLRESIETGMQWAVFEPNAEDLWSKVRRNVGAFLNSEWAAGALVGATPEQAYYVRCDATTNPPDVRAQGQLVTELGVAPVEPAEFVIFRITQWAGPAQ
jgi:phage tail sheath protein FI